MYNKNNKEIMVVIGRLWRDSHGNTYHTSEVISKDYTDKSDITYGYGNQFIATAREMVEAKGLEWDNYHIINRQVMVNRKGDL